MNGSANGLSRLAAELEFGSKDNEGDLLTSVMRPADNLQVLI